MIHAVAAFASPTPSWSHRGRGARWEIVSLSVRGDDSIEEARTLRVTPIDDGFGVVTERTRVVVDGPAGRTVFDSAAPTDADPWPLSLQHVVASVPAAVTWASGAIAHRDPDGWADAATDALLQSGLPREAVATGFSLVDAAGWQDDLRRWFPGPPPDDGAWKRPERLAGVAVERAELCSTSRDGRRQTWVCEGAAADPTGTLRDAKVWTEVVADGGGLRVVESGYEGVLDLRGDGRGLVVVAGRRRAERFPPLEESR